MKDYSKTWTTNYLPIVLSVCALALTIYNGSLERQYRRLSVRPKILLRWETTETTATWSFRNYGLGPGEVLWMDITFGDGYMRNWQTVVNEVPGVRIDQVESPQALMLRAGDSKVLVKFSWDDPHMPGQIGPVLRRLLNLFEHYFRYDFCYKSMYDERWMLTGALLLDSPGQESHDSCPARPPHQILDNRVAIGGL